MVLTRGTSSLDKHGLDMILISFWIYLPAVLDWLSILFDLTSLYRLALGQKFWKKIVDFLGDLGTKENFKILLTFSMNPLLRPSK